MRLFLLAVLCSSLQAFAVDLPDEYTSVGASSIGLGYAGSVANNGVAAVILNPALIVLEKSYYLSAGYTWAKSGRNFYQAGVVDGKTTNVSAGMFYTGFHEEFDAQSFLHKELDAPIERRGVLAFSTMIAKIALGISGQYVEGYRFSPAINGLQGLHSVDHQYDDTDFSKVRGVTVGGGVAVALLPSLRLGASVANLGNRNVRDFSPRTIRAGIAYFPLQVVDLHLDYEERESVPLFAGEQDTPTRLATASASITVYNMVKILCAYAHDLHAGLGDAGAVSAGFALTSDNVSLSYGFKKHFNDSGLQHAVNLGFSVAI